MGWIHRDGQVKTFRTGENGLCNFDVRSSDFQGRRRRMSCISSAVGWFYGFQKLHFHGRSPIVRVLIFFLQIKAAEIEGLNEPLSPRRFGTFP